MNEIKIFAPATVANVACGFDVLGFCLETVGDTMLIRKTKEKGIKITKVTGFDLPLEATKNVAGVSALAMVEALQPDCGFEIEIYKAIKPGSGIGSSAASAAGSVYAINELLGQPCNKNELTAYAMKGEALASQSEHADNLAPAIFGGFTLVKSIAPTEILALPTPSNLYATVLYPQIEIKTAESRALLPKTVQLKEAVLQSSYLASFVHALHTQDYDLLSHALTDILIEPHRSQLIPEFHKVKQAVLETGALGCGISGSGPSIFALSKGLETAKEVEKIMTTIYASTQIPFETYLSTINQQGIKTL